MKLISPTGTPIERAATRGLFLSQGTAGKYAAAAVIVPWPADGDNAHIDALSVGGQCRFLASSTPGYLVYWDPSRGPGYASGSPRALAGATEIAKGDYTGKKQGSTAGQTVLYRCTGAAVMAGPWGRATEAVCVVVPGVGVGFARQWDVRADVAKLRPEQVELLTRTPGVPDWLRTELAAAAAADAAVDEAMERAEEARAAGGSAHYFPPEFFGWLTPDTEKDAAGRPYVAPPGASLVVLRVTGGGKRFSHTIQATAAQQLSEPLDYRGGWAVFAVRPGWRVEVTVYQDGRSYSTLTADHSGLTSGGERHLWAARPAMEGGA